MLKVDVFHTVAEAIRALAEEQVDIAVGNFPYDSEVTICRVYARTSELAEMIKDTPGFTKAEQVQGFHSFTIIGESGTAFSALESRFSLIDMRD